MSDKNEDGKMRSKSQGKRNLFTRRKNAQRLMSFAKQAYPPHH